MITIRTHQGPGTDLSYVPSQNPHGVVCLTNQATSPLRKVCVDFGLGLLSLELAEAIKPLRTLSTDERCSLLRGLQSLLKASHELMPDHPKILVAGGSAVLPALALLTNAASKAVHALVLVVTPSTADAVGALARAALRRPEQSPSHIEFVASWEEVPAAVAAASLSFLNSPGSAPSPEVELALVPGCLG